MLKNVLYIDKFGHEQKWEPGAGEPAGNKAAVAPWLRYLLV